MFMKAEKKKKHPVIAAMLTVFSVAGVVGLWRTCAKKCGKAAEKMKNFFTSHTCASDCDEE